MDIDELYLRYIKPLSPTDQRLLLARVTRGLGEDDDTPHEHSLLEFEGLGAEIWQDIDPQAYVDALRDEWESRP